MMRINYILLINLELKIIINISKVNINRTLTFIRKIQTLNNY